MTGNRPKHKLWWGNRYPILSLLTSYFGEEVCLSCSSSCNCNSTRATHPPLGGLYSVLLAARGGAHGRDRKPAEKLGSATHRRRLRHVHQSGWRWISVHVSVLVHVHVCDANPCRFTATRVPFLIASQRAALVASQVVVSANEHVYKIEPAPDPRVRTHKYGYGHRHR